MQTLYLSLSLYFYDLLSKFVNLLDWKTAATDIFSLQHATKTQTSLRKCAFSTHQDTHKV